MENGLKFNPGSVNVMVRDGSSGAETTYAPTTTVEKEGGESDTVINYEVIPNGDHEFEIEFSPSFCNGLNTNDRLVVTYSAMLTRNAEIGNGTDDDLPNTNTAHMHYGEGHYTNSDTTTTKTYGFDLVKTDGQNKLLDGAEFIIYSEENGGHEITVVPLVYEGQTEQAKTPDGYYLYRKARADEAGQVIKVTDGMVRVVGLDNGVYWLEEKTHPSGYNPIETRQKFTIADNNLYAIVNSDKIVSTNSGVQVVNYTGTMLPETGGLGTLLFTILGGGTVLTSGVVLVTKKRMSKIEDED